MHPALWRDLASSVLQKVLINSEKCLHFQQNTISVQLRQKCQKAAKSQVFKREHYFDPNANNIAYFGMIITIWPKAFDKK